MGALFSTSHYQEKRPKTYQPINQIYNVKFGYAPVGPSGSIPSIPKRHLHNNGSIYRHRRRH